MSVSALEKLIWVLIYAGLLTLCLGLFVERRDATAGWHFIAWGASAAALGAVLVWVRSRRR